MDDSAPALVERHEALLTTPDGFQVHAWLAVPAPARAAVLLCHGITTDSKESGFFIEIEQRLTRAQFACARFDFRAHGASGGSPKNVTLRGELVDLTTVRGWLDSLLDVPVFFMAASFAASAAVHDAHSSSCAGLVLINPILDYPGVFVHGESEWGRAIIDSYHTTALGELGDTDVVGRLPGSDYVVTVRLLDEIKSDKTLERVGSTIVPTLIFHGSADTLVPVAPVRRLGDTNPFVDAVIYEGGRHGLKDFRPDLLTRVEHWLADHA